MKFFRDLRMDVYPVDAIRKMVHCEPSETRHYSTYEVYLLDGDRCRIDTIEAGKLLRSNLKYVSAYPGCTVLTDNSEDGANDPFWRAPVLAWAINEDGGLTPVTGEGVVEDSGWLIATPDGRIADAFGGTFDNEESCLQCSKEAE